MRETFTNEANTAILKQIYALLRILSLEHNEQLHFKSILFSTSLNINTSNSELFIQILTKYLDWKYQYYYKISQNYLHK